MTDTTSARSRKAGKAKAPRKQPWLKFYPSDWRSDPLLRSCSLASRGLWLEMLALMHEANPRGSLLLNGKAPSMNLLAALVGAPETEVMASLAQLEERGVFSRDRDGTIYSRRMRRDVEKAAVDSANGSLGGNPALKGHHARGVNPPVKPPVKRGDKAHWPLASGSTSHSTFPVGSTAQEEELQGNRLEDTRETVVPLNGRRS